MAEISSIGRVMIPVSDQDAAIAFYTEKLGFELTADTPFGDGERWVEVTPTGGGASLALVPPRGDYQTSRMTGVALDTSDAAAVQADLKGKGVDVDAATMGGDGTVPLLFFLRDVDGNSLMVVQMLG
jgi:catechol 2,3-dioxygenase-like lactoylglutathione lyase family enzyme